MADDEERLAIFYYLYSSTTHITEYLKIVNSKSGKEIFSEINHEKVSPSIKMFCRPNVDSVSLLRAALFIPVGPTFNRALRRLSIIVLYKVLLNQAVFLLPDFAK